MGAGNMVTYQANNYYADPTYGPMVAALQFPAFNYTRGGIRTEKTDATLETIWTKMYNTITNANLLLQELKTTDVAFETGVKELLTGEALAVRAYLHLDLVGCSSLPTCRSRAGRPNASPTWRRSML